jgi:hypothetical protein
VKIVKTKITGRFLVQNSIFEIRGGKIKIRSIFSKNRSVFSVYRLVFDRFFIQNSNFKWKTVNRPIFPVYRSVFPVFGFSKISKILKISNRTNRFLTNRQNLSRPILHYLFKMHGVQNDDFLQRGSAYPFYCSS